MSETVPLTLAVHDYDHVRDLASGAVGVEGVALTLLQYPGRGDLLPLHPLSRVGRLGALAREVLLAARRRRRLARRDPGVHLARVPPLRDLHPRRTARVDDPAALAGARIGVPEWTQTATVYARGLLAHEYGRGARGRSTWVQAGTNEPGRTEGVAVTLPAGIALTARPDATLDELLRGRRARRPDRRTSAARVQTRRRARSCACSRPPRGRGGLLPAHRRLPDHARRRAAGRGPRAPPVDRDEPAERVRRGQATQRRARAGRQRARASRCRGRPPTPQRARS